MSTRAGRANVLTIILVAFLAAIGVSVATFGPYYLDYLNMKEVCSSSALAWYASSEEKSAHTRFLKGLEKKEIDYIDKDQCEFKKQGDTIQVYCYWEAYAYYPFTDYYKILEFEVDTYVDGRGGVEQY
jgi:hypothetical protein